MKGDDENFVLIYLVRGGVVHNSLTSKQPAGSQILLTNATLITSESSVTMDVGGSSDEPPPSSTSNFQLIGKKRKAPSSTNMNDDVKENETSNKETTRPRPGKKRKLNPQLDLSMANLSTKDLAADDIDIGALLSGKSFSSNDVEQKTLRIPKKKSHKLVCIFCVLNVCTHTYALQQLIDECMDEHKLEGLLTLRKKLCSVPCVDEKNKIIEEFANETMSDVPTLRSWLRRNACKDASSSGTSQSQVHVKGEKFDPFAHMATFLFAKTFVAVTLLRYTLQSLTAPEPMFCCEYFHCNECFRKKKSYRIATDPCGCQRCCDVVYGCETPNIPWYALSNVCGIPVFVQHFSVQGNSRLTKEIKEYVRGDVGRAIQLVYFSIHETQQVIFGACGSEDTTLNTMAKVLSRSANQIIRSNCKGRKGLPKTLVEASRQFNENFVKYQSKTWRDVQKHLFLWNLIKTWCKSDSGVNLVDDHGNVLINRSIARFLAFELFNHSTYFKKAFNWAGSERPHFIRTVLRSLVDEEDVEADLVEFATILLCRLELSHAKYQFLRTQYIKAAKSLALAFPLFPPLAKTIECYRNRLKNVQFHFLENKEGETAGYRRHSGDVFHKCRLNEEYSKRYRILSSSDGQGLELWAGKADGARQTKTGIYDIEVGITSHNIPKECMAARDNLYFPVACLLEKETYGAVERVAGKSFVEWAVRNSHGDLHPVHLKPVNMIIIGVFDNKAASTITGGGSALSDHPSLYHRENKHLVKHLTKWCPISRDLGLARRMWVKRCQSKLSPSQCCGQKERDLWNGCYLTIAVPELHLRLRLTASIFQIQVQIALLISPTGSCQGLVDHARTCLRVPNFKIQTYANSDLAFVSFNGPEVATLRKHFAKWQALISRSICSQFCNCLCFRN